MSKKQKSPTNTPQPSPNDVVSDELRKLLLWGVMACVVGYCLLFLITPFGPFDDRVQRPDRFLRFDFFLRLLNIEYFQFAWFGDTNTFSISVPFQKIIAVTTIIAIGAFGIGYSILFTFRLLKRLTICEHYVFSSAIGLSVISTFVLAIGLFGGLAAIFSQVCVLICVFVGSIVAIILLNIRLWVPFYTRFFTDKPLSVRAKLTTFHKFVLLLAVPSLLMLLFGGLLPPVEYDVTSYHIPGAKHFYETGGISFMPNNVYTNMPFGAEMLYVFGMMLAHDWYIGSLVGKLLIAYCTFIAACGVYAFGKRLHSSQAGMVGFLLYVSLPWVNWVSTAGLIDCVFGMYLLLTVFALYLYVQSCNSDIEQRTLLYMAAYLAGSAAACKYTAVPFLVLPLGAFTLYFACKRPDATRLQFDKRAAATLGFCILSIALACGLWYAKNLYHTGNPTYPLMHRVFGDRTGTWDAAKNERWHTAHSSTDFSGEQMVRDFKRTTLGSDWLAPVLVPLALLPFLRRKQNRVLLALAVYLVFYFALWWLLTHRLERFWVPVLPLVAVLAGIGAMFYTRTTAEKSEPEASAKASLRTWSIFLCVLLVFNTAYTFFPNAVSAPGKYSRFGMGVEAARVDPNRVMPLVLHFNANPPSGKLLLVGDAEVFDYNVPVLYNTCFDDTPFDELFFDLESRNDPPSLRSPDDMQHRLNEAGISHIVVNWAEIARFRSKGNYGYTSDLVQPDMFAQLVRLGVLRPVPRALESPGGIPTLSEQFVYEVTIISRVRR